MCLLTNNTLWREAGLDPNKDFPKTWEELPAVAEKLTKRDANGVPIRRGFDFDWPIRHVSGSGISTMMHQLGANWSTRTPTRRRWIRAGGTAWVQFWVDWANK